MRAIAPSLSRLLIVVALTTLTGCASGSLDRLGPYIQARSDDLSDVVRFRIAPGQVGLYADAEVTSALAPAVGFGDVAVFPHWALGWDPYDSTQVGPLPPQVRTAAFPTLLLGWPIYGYNETQDGFEDTSPYWRGFVAPWILMGNEHGRERSRSLFALHHTIPNPRLVPKRVPERPIADRFWVGGSVTALVASLGAAVNLAELADFVVGWFGWDLLRDDPRDRPEPTPPSDTPATTAPDSPKE